MIEWIKKLFGFAPATVGEVVVQGGLVEGECCAPVATRYANVAPQADVTTASIISDPVKPKAKRKPYYGKKASPKASTATLATPKKTK